MTRPFTLAQITDTHLLADRRDRLRGCNPWDTLQGVLTQVAPHQPDGLLLTGDLADQGSAAAYGDLLQAVQGVACPVYWLPGNHDHLPTLQTVFRAPQCQGLQSVDLGSWRLLLLDSVFPQATFGEGHLAADQLHWLRAELARQPTRPTAIALHHHPVPTGIDWLDQIPLQNAADLHSLLEGFPQVRLVLFGHIHQTLQHQVPRPDGTALTFYGCPSTCLQVAPANPDPQDHLPGFRLLHLYPDGHHRTQVYRVSPAPMTL